MGKRIVATIVTLATTVGCSSMMDPDTHSRQGMMTHMKSFDRNGDEMLSKDEFMKAHEAMFDSMKGPNGMIDLKNMQMHGKGMMGHAK